MTYLSLTNSPSLRGWWGRTGGVITYHLIPTKCLAKGSAQYEYNVSLKGFVFIFYCVTNY